MTQGRVTIEHGLGVLASLTGSGAVSVAIASLPEVAAILLAIVSATSTCLAAVQRWLPPRRDMFEQGYRLGFVDAVQEHVPYPVDNVRPLRPVK